MDLRAPVRKAFYKQASFLVRSLQHPSLHAKKFDQANDVWQARVNRSWRFYFTVSSDTYTVTGITPHPK